MKVIVDTNVLVSAAIADGKPENAIYAIVTRLEWEWVISAEVLAEYREVLRVHLNFEENQEFNAFWEWGIGNGPWEREYFCKYEMLPVLNRPKLRLSNEKKQRWFDLIETATVNFEVAVEVDFPRDPKDEKFWALAIASGAEVMVTGDKDFEDLEALLPATIVVSPSEFMELAG